MSKLHKHITKSDFIPFRKIYERITGVDRKDRPKPVFTDVSQLGLINNLEYENFFRSMCDENYSIKFARLNRVVFKQFLQDRYSDFVGERILSFLENEFVPLLRIDFQGWCRMLMDLLNAGP